MPGFFNPLDADKWRELVNNFDAKRGQFFDNLNALQQTRGATPDLEARRKDLIRQASPIQKNIERLMGSLETVRAFLKGIGNIFNIGQPSQVMGALGVAPIPLAIGLGAAAVIVNSITNWLGRVQTFAAQNKQAEILAAAGATPAEIIAATQAGVGAQSSAKIFGFDVRWLLAIGALFIVAPFALKEIQKGR